MIDRIGGLRLDRVSPQILQALYSDLTKQGHSPRTVRYTHTILNSALKNAVAWKLLRDNPCQHVALPKAQHLEMDVWSAEEVNAFLKATRGSRDHVLWYTLLNTGMRPGEAFGLKWEDVDGDRIRIQRAVSQTAEQGVYALEAPKTERSKRSIAISAEHVALLESHRRRQMGEILSKGSGYIRQDFIFADLEGHHEFTERARGRWKTAVRRAGVRKIRLYDCRHTHATLLLKADINPKVRLRAPRSRIHRDYSGARRSAVKFWTTESFVTYLQPCASRYAGRGCRPPLLCYLAALRGACKRPITSHKPHLKVPP